MAHNTAPTTHININLPPVRKFSGEDGDSHGITNFITHIEKNTEHQFGDDNSMKEPSMVSTFREYLCGDAKDFWAILLKEHGRKWETVKATYIKMIKTEREQRLIAKARSQMASLKLKREDTLSQYGGFRIGLFAHFQPPVHCYKLYLNLFHVPNHSVPITVNGQG